MFLPTPEFPKMGVNFKREKLNGKLTSKGAVFLIYAKFERNTDLYLMFQDLNVLQAAEQ